MKPKSKLFIEILASLLLIFFVHTLLSTFVQLQSLKNLLVFYSSIAKKWAWPILIIETIIAALLFIPRTRLWGFTLSTLFAFATIIIMINWPHSPHDFGGLFNDINNSQKWVLSTSIASLSILGVVLILTEKKLPAQQSTEREVIFT